MFAWHVVWITVMCTCFTANFRFFPQHVLQIVQILLDETDWIGQKIEFVWFLLNISLENWTPASKIVLKKKRTFHKLLHWRMPNGFIKQISVIWIVTSLSSSTSTFTDLSWSWISKWRKLLSYLWKRYYAWGIPTLLISPY